MRSACPLPIALPPTPFGWRNVWGGGLVLMSHQCHASCTTCDITPWRHDMKHKLIHLSRLIWEIGKSFVGGHHCPRWSPSPLMPCPRDAGRSQRARVGQLYLASPDAAYFLAI